MMEKLLFFCLIFLLGELLVNFSFYKYLKGYFDIEDNTSPQKPFLKIKISIFKGSLERFLMFFSLIIDLPQILILFGAIKIGTRLEKNDKIKNDYFLIGNLSSVLFSIIYHFIYQYIIYI